MFGYARQYWESYWLNVAGESYLFKSRVLCSKVAHAFTSSNDVRVNILGAICALFDLVLLGVNSIILYYFTSYGTKAFMNDHS